MILYTRTRHSVDGDQNQKHIWEKMWRSWIWVADHKLTEYDWFLKVQCHAEIQTSSGSTKLLSV